MKKLKKIEKKFTRFFFNDSEVFICAIYDSSEDSKHRYTIKDFQKLLKSIPKSKPALICGDLNSPDANWKASESPNGDENLIIELFEDELFRQAIYYPTYSQITLVIAFYRNCFLNEEIDKKLTKIYDCTDHEASHLSLKCPVTECNPVLQNFRSFRNADYDGLNVYLKNPFEPICYTYIKNMYDELHQYLDKGIEIFVPRRTRHRQRLPPWCSNFTSNLMKKLNTPRILSKVKQNNYRR